MRTPFQGLPQKPKYLIVVRDRQEFEAAQANPRKKLELLKQHLEKVEILKKLKDK